jgi:hypothetical protein
VCRCRNHTVRLVRWNSKLEVFSELGSELRVISGYCCTALRLSPGKDRKAILPAIKSIYRAGTLTQLSGAGPGDTRRDHSELDRVSFQSRRC